MNLKVREYTVVASALLACCCLNVNAQEKAPPNVLLIAVDDLNDWVGCLSGHPDTRTPNIDRLAKRGVLFFNAHCQSTMCQPSRTSIMFGMRPSTTGFYNNPVNGAKSVPFTSKHVSMPRYFAAGGYKTLTTRERVLAHQEEPQCANCHRKIDPIGFGLENFTAAGKWRTQDGHGKRAYDIDPSGKFHNGPEFANYFELRDRIAERENDFARGFTEALIGYGLGRPFGFTDQDLAVGIIASAKKEEFSVIEFIHALVQSKAFATK